MIFHEEGHPDFPWFKQCVTFNFFPTPTHKLIYNLFHMLAMYGLPLVIMTLSYSLILIEISKKTRQSRGKIYILGQYIIISYLSHVRATTAHASLCKCAALLEPLMHTYPNEPGHEISNNVVCANSKGSDQPAHTRSLIRAFASRLNNL